MAAQRIPVNVYRDEVRIMLAAPLPGLEPADTHLSIDARQVQIEGEPRGPGERTREYLQREWTAGRYDRTVDLPTWVDVAAANATYGNGVLVVIVPLADAPASGTVTPAKVGTSKGRRTGHVGQEWGALSPGPPG